MSPIRQRNVLSRLVAALHQGLPALLAMAALGLAVLGQQRFDLEDTTTQREGLLLFGAGALCLALARLLLRPTAESAAPVARDVERPPVRQRLFGYWRWTLSALGLGIITTVLIAMARLPSPPPPETAYGGYVWGWLLASLLVTLPWLIPSQGVREAGTQVRLWLHEHRWELLALALITLLAAWLRLVNLAGAPFAISGDEGGLGTEVYRVFSGDLRNPFGTTIYGPYPSMVPFILALPMRLFGNAIGPLRLTGALFGILAVPTLWLLARPMTGRRLALIATLFLAAYPLHIHYSRVAVNVVWDSFFFTGALALFWWGMQPHVRALWPFALAGLLGGLGQYSYTGSRLLPLLLFAFLLYLLLLNREWLRGKWQGLLLMTIVFAVVSGPLYLYALQEPDEFNARVNQMGILQNGWLDLETKLRGEGTLPVLWDQFRRTLYGFAFFGDRSTSWGIPAPLAYPLLSLGLFLGLMVSLRHWRNPAVVLLHGWFWATILSAGVLTVNPPTSNRFVSLTPLVCLFASLGWEAVSRALAHARPPAEQRLAQTVLLGLFAGLVSLMGVRAQERQLADNLFGGPEALVATTVGYRLQELPPDTTLMMMMAPRLFSDISTLAYMVPTYQRLDLIDPLTAPPTDPSGGSGDLLFILLPERVGEASYIQQAFPGSIMREVRRENQERTLLYYEILVDR